jgi:hypothetical protein
MVGRELYGSVGTCKFTVEAYVYNVLVKKKKKIKVVCYVVFLLEYFELKVSVYGVYMVYDYLFICSVLVENDQNIIILSLVIYHSFTFQPSFYVCFFQDLQVDFSHCTGDG